MKNSVYFPFSQSFIAGNGGNNQSQLPGLIYSQSDDEARQMLFNSDYLQHNTGMQQNNQQ